MLSWISANLATIIPLLVVAGAMALAIRSMHKNKNEGKSSCGCGCGGCAMSDACHPQQPASSDPKE